MRILTWTAGLSVLALAACGSPEATDETTDAATATATSEMTTQTATATLMMADGTPAGTATATESDGGLTISLMAEGLPPGEHGVHVHTVGKCDAPDFKSAEGHWNPEDTKHGLESEGGQHAGDMPNLSVGDDGKGTLEYTLKGGTWAGLMDADGSAFVVHEGKDDQKTDPSGDSGSRIACGVFAAG